MTTALIALALRLDNNMRQRDLLLVGVLMLLALFAGWYWGARDAHIGRQQQAIAGRLTEIETRMKPLEMDLNRREKNRNRLKGILSWTASKLRW